MLLVTALYLRQLFGRRYMSSTRTCGVWELTKVARGYLEKSVAKKVFIHQIKKKGFM